MVVVCGCVCGGGVGGGDWPHAYGTVDMPLLVFRHNNFIDVCDISYVNVERKILYCTNVKFCHNDTS